MGALQFPRYYNQFLCTPRGAITTSQGMHECFLVMMSVYIYCRYAYTISPLKFKCLFRLRVLYIKLRLVRWYLAYTSDQ